MIFGGLRFANPPYGPVTSHGPVDAKRHEELETLFAEAEPGLVFVSTFPDRKTFTKYAEQISWERRSGSPTAQTTSFTTTALASSDRTTMAEDDCALLSS